MSKRRRTRTGFSSAARPIDKSLVVIFKSAVAATTVSTALAVGKLPCTVKGVRWTGVITGDAGTAGNTHRYAWAIVLVRDGYTHNELNFTSDAESLYEPEQDVIAFGVGTSGDNGTTELEPIKWEGQTKSMRKLKVGDKMEFLVEGIAVETVSCNFIVQLFCAT